MVLDGYATELLAILATISLANLGFMAMIVRKLSSLETKVDPLWKAYKARAQASQHKQRPDGGSVPCPDLREDDDA